MKMKYKLVLILCLVTLFAYGQEKPNIILFLVDDLGWKDISCAGSEFYETPNIDKLAKKGTRFVNSYAAHPRCVPSRFATMTGKFPARAKNPGKGGQMALSEFTLGEAMQEAGYTTFFSGKWHLGHTESHWPQNQGFDINIGGCSAGAPTSYFAPYNIHKVKSEHKAKTIVGMENVADSTYITDHITDVSVDFIRRHKEKPFFAVIAHYAVHTPIEAKPELVEKYNNKLKGMSFDGEDFIFGEDGRQKMHQNDPVYAAMIESVDESLGQIIEALKVEGILKNTIIIFTSDHGGLSNSGLKSKRPLATSNLPLRAGKGHCYEGGIKIPTIAFGPQYFRKGKIAEDIITGTDIYPSILEMAQQSLKPEQHLDGVSFVPALSGKSLNSQDRIFFWHSPKARPSSTGDHNCSVIRKGNYKLFHYYDDDRVELYNLNEDPTESENLANALPEVKNKLLNSLKSWKEDINAYEDKKLKQH